MEKSVKRKDRTARRHLPWAPQAPSSQARLHDLRVQGFLIRWGQAPTRSCPDPHQLLTLSPERIPQPPKLQRAPYNLEQSESLTSALGAGDIDMPPPLAASRGRVARPADLQEC